MRTKLLTGAQPLAVTSKIFFIRIGEGQHHILSKESNIFEHLPHAVGRDIDRERRRKAEWRKSRPVHRAPQLCSSQSSNRQRPMANNTQSHHYRT